jgi:putative colanic acid biosynthesis UDP-glucose lipid carrier transferase
MKNKKPILLFLIDLLVFFSFLVILRWTSEIPICQSRIGVLKLTILYIISYISSYQYKVNERNHIYQLIYSQVSFLIIMIVWLVLLNYFTSILVPIDQPLFLKLFFGYLLTSLLFKKMTINWFRGSSFHTEALKQAIVLGQDSYTAAFKKDLLLNKWLGYHIVELDDSMLKKESHSDLIDYIEQQQIRAIFINTSQVELNYERTKLFNKLFEHKLIEIKLISEQFANKLKRSSYDLFGHFPVVNMFEFPLDKVFNRIAKRSFDVLFSLTVIVLVLSWLIPILSLIIWLDSRGPVFYRHYRVGYLKQSFACFKFRTMKLSTEPQPFAQTVKNDTRVTKVGRFLRKYNLDEMPQFINVLLGDISVVGPRPMMIEHMQEFEDEIEEMYSRHWIKPGVTGLAQVMGYRGEIDSVQKMKGRIQNDLYYIYNWSFFLDLKIIWWTIRNMILGDENAI